MRINYSINYGILWEKMALHFFFLVPSPTRLVTENGGNSSSSSCDTSHFSPMRMAQPALTPLSCTASLTWAESEHGHTKKTESCPSDQLLITFQHNFSDEPENRISWGARFGVGCEVRKECIQPGTPTAFPSRSSQFLYSLVLQNEVTYQHWAETDHAYIFSVSVPLFLLSRLPTHLHLSAASVFPFAFCFTAIHLKVIRILTSNI